MPPERRYCPGTVELWTLAQNLKPGHACDCMIDGMMSSSIYFFKSLVDLWNWLGMVIKETTIRLNQSVSIDSVTPGRNRADRLMAL